jgi:hypothetical protein
MFASQSSSNCKHVLVISASTFEFYSSPHCAVINVTIYPGSYQVEESDTTVLFNVSRNDDVILDRNVSVRVTATAVTAGGNKLL